MQLAKIPQDYKEASNVGFYVEISDFRASVAIENIRNRYQALELWMIKLLWDSSVKIPRYLQCLKKHAEFLKTVFLLCERCHSFKFGKSYKNTSEWFHACLREFCVIEMDLCINQELPTIESSWKKAYIEWNRNFVKTLRTNKNPYTSPALKELIDSAIALKNQSSVFYKENWQPFLKAFSGYTQEIKINKDLKHGYIEKNRYIIQNGQGKSMASKVTVATLDIDCHRDLM